MNSDGWVRLQRGENEQKENNQKQMQKSYCRSFYCRKFYCRKRLSDTFVLYGAFPGNPLMFTVGRSPGETPSETIEE